MRQDPPAPSKLSDKVTIPALVDAIILKMAAKDRERRFADAQALCDEIARTQLALDRTPDRFEAYRVVAVIGATMMPIYTDRTFSQPPFLGGSFDPLVWGWCNLGVTVFSTERHRVSLIHRI